MGKLKFTFALWTAKAARTALRVLGRNATYLPGAIALKIYPSFLERIGKPPQVIVVTGTNGKTTVANLLSIALKKHGQTVLDNRLGSNTAAGIACALLSKASLTGRARHDVAVLEVDERSSARILPFIRPALLIITNIFRDSIMRNAHPEFIAGIISDSVPQKTKLLINADDLISCGIAPENPRAYFGLERMETDVIECINLINDFQVCPLCQNELEYEYRRYHHIGRANCQNCGFGSPVYDYAGVPDTRRGTITIKDQNDSRELKLLSDSIFNIYNILTVFAALSEMGLKPDEAIAAMDGVKIPDSRYNETKINGTHIIMQMAKDRNALACSRAFDYIAAKPGKKELILMMNNISDSKAWSENTCWLYDCDFELLHNDEITRIVSTGPRALDYCLRLQFAGIPEEKLRFAEQEINAPKELELSPGVSVYILYGTDAIDLAYRVRDAVKERAKREN